MSRSQVAVYFVVTLLAGFATAQESNQQMIVALPEVSSNSLPSDAFITAIAQAARLQITTGTGNTLTIAALDKTAVAYAKIILHSYGVDERAVHFTVATNAVVSHQSGDGDHQIPHQFQTAIVVLGNRPLDDNTPTVDMVQRVNAACGYAKSRPEPALILTGAPTVGQISEARMMGLIALSRGFPRSRIILEEESWTTGRNAAFTAPIVARLGVKQVFLVSKKSHLQFALPEFRKYPVFKNIAPVESPEVHEQSIREMIDYLKLHDDPEVRGRLEALKNNSHGVD